MHGYIFIDHPSQGGNSDINVADGTGVGSGADALLPRLWSQFEHNPRSTTLSTKRTPLGLARGELAAEYRLSHMDKHKLPQ